MAGLVASCPQTLVPFKPNRATIFAASFFHATEPFYPPPSYANSRTFMTFLYGDHRAPAEHVALAPPEKRAAFAAALLREPDAHDEL